MELQNLVKTLNQKGFKAHFCENKEQANKLILDLVKPGQSIGIGGSMTVKDMGIDKQLFNNGVEVFSHSLVSPEKKNDLYEYARHADWYMASANAVLANGDLVNMDGTGNRVSTLIFGVPNVIYVIGKNKLVDTYEQAIDRIQNYVCHLNAVRLERETPCRYTGKCGHCSGGDCMCNVEVITHHPTKCQKQVHIILINEELGY